jgi:hypothetical protein
MSQPKFAPITASLLARKGSAAPSMMPAFMPSISRIMPEVPKPTPRLPEMPEASVSDGHAGPEVPHDPARPKKLFVAFSHAEHERLAIAAVKTGLSRHQLVRDALEMYFEQLVQDMGHECHCVSGTCGAFCA